MSKNSTSRPRATRQARKFAIVASAYNARFVQGLIEHATAELRSLAPAAVISLHQVPGAFEIPVVVQEIARRKKPDAILALGVILKGKTSHAVHLARSVTDALQQIAVAKRIPVVHAVLSLETDSQARQRCLGPAMNRGTEAARTAVAMADVMQNLGAK